MKTKKRRVADLLETRDVLELTTAAEVALRQLGERGVAEMVKDIISHPDRVTETKKLRSKSEGRMLSKEKKL